MSTNELRVLDFVEGNMELYEAESAKLLGRAVTAREAIECICDCSTDYDKIVYEAAKQVVIDNYNTLVKQNGDIPCWGELLEYIEADSYEALYDLADCYWHLHKDERASREEYMEILNQKGEDEARDFLHEALSSVADWIMESEYYSAYPNHWIGVLTLLNDLDFSFQIDRSCADTLDYVEDMPPHVSVTINDAQNVLFPTMVMDYAGAFDSSPYEYAGPITGLARRKDVKDALLLEKEAS